MRLSQRVARISISSTAKVFAEASKLKSQGIDLVDLGAGEPDFPTPQNIKQAAIQAIHKNFTRYTPTDGINELKEAIVYRHTEDFQSNYTPEEVLVTSGGKHAIFNLISALIDPGDEVVIPSPYWVTFREAVSYAGGDCKFVKTTESENFRLTALQIENALSEKTRLILLNSPNNPSGAVISQKELHKIAKLAYKRNIMLLSDECYCHFVYGGLPQFSMASLSKTYQENLIIIGSVSKTYSMTGWRVGYCLASPILVKAMLKIQSHCTSNANSIAQKAAVEALLGSQNSVQTMHIEYSKRRAFIVQALNEIPGISCNWPDGAFYVYPNVKQFLGGVNKMTASHLALQLLHKAHVAVVPGEAFGTHEHLRLSYANSIHQLKEGVNRLKTFFETL
jgi:aspartate aminotransferase